MSIGTKSLPQLTLLVVDDDDDVRELAVSMFEMLDCTVHHARHGREALNILKAHPEINLLFTDISMPMMSGEELVQEALKLRPDLKIVFATGYAARDPHGYKVMHKPYRMQDVLKTIEEVTQD